MPRANRPLSQIEMCQVILLALPYSLQATYYAHKGVKHFATDVLELKEDLQLIMPTYALTAKLVAQVTKQAAQSTPVKPPAKDAADTRKTGNGNKKPDGKSGKGDPPYKTLPALCPMEYLQ